MVYDAKIKQAIEKQLFCLILFLLAPKCDVLVSTHREGSHKKYIDYATKMNYAKTYLH